MDSENWSRGWLRGRLEWWSNWRQSTGHTKHTSARNKNNIRKHLQEEPVLGGPYQGVMVKFTKKEKNSVACSQESLQPSSPNFDDLIDHSRWLSSCHMTYLESRYICTTCTQCHITDHNSIRHSWVIADIHKLFYLPVLDGLHAWISWL